jgi:Cytochrome P460
MKSKRMLISVGIVTSLAVVSGIAIHAAQDQNKYALKVPNGLAVSEFKGYESWQLISISQRGDTIAAILGNPVIIEAYKSGIPGNGKPFPDGSKMAKIHWNAKKADTEPGDPTVLATQHDIDFMVKDSKRFPDGHGWGYGAFELDAATNTFRIANMQDHPPQAHDAKCGVACHDAAQDRDYVFTRYATR